MKLRNFLVNLTIGAAALSCGLSLVGIYQFFVGNILNLESETTELKETPKAPFDINDPNSVLPINYEEEKLSDPKEDETNESMFDPEGTYTLSYEFERAFPAFKGFIIKNKNYDVDCDDKAFGKTVRPSGYAAVDKIKGKRMENLLKLAVYATKEVVRDSEIFEAHRNESHTFNYFYPDLENLGVKPNKIEFQTDERLGVSYEFIGEFLIKGNFYTLAPNVTVIEGILILRINGKKVAQNKVTFKWQPDIACPC